MKYIQIIFNFIYAVFLRVASIIIGVLYSGIQRANYFVYREAARVHQKATEGDLF